MPAVAGLLAAIGSAIGAAVSALGTGGFLASIGGQLLASVALSALSRALAPKPKQPGVRTTATMAGGANADGFVLGWYATEGQLVCPAMSHGKSGKTPNAYLTYVIEVGAPGQSLDSLIIDGEPVTLGATPHADGYGLPVQGRFEGCAWVKYYDGTQTTANHMLVAQYGSYERPWTAAHVGTGIAHAILTFRFDREVYSGFPKVRFVLNGIALYDPRKDSTAGGAGAQRWSNPATWAASVNPMVMIYNILRGITLPGGHIWGGECEAGDLPYARWAAAMDDCDEAHDGAARYRAGFEVLVEDEPYSVIEELLTTCGGQLAEVGGEWVPAVGAPDLPVMFITDDDVIVTEADEFNPFPSPEATYNGVSATFPRPSSVWEPSEIQPIYFPALEAEDGGRRLMASLQINACPYAKQVRRVAREAVRDSRRWRRHSISLPPEASVLQPLDTISWASARNGYATKLFEVVEVARDLRGASVAVVLRERDPSDYDFAAEALPTPPSVLPVRPASQAVPGWSVSAATIADGAGTARRPALQFGWTADAAEDATGLRWEIRRGGTSTVALRGTTQDIEAGSLTIAAGVLPATGYEARARLIIGKRRTAWSSWLSATTPDAYLGADDVSDDFIDEIERIADVAGIRTVSTLPAAGEKPNQVVMLVPPGRLYRWDATAGAWTTQLYSGIEPGSLQLAGFAAGIEPVGIITSPTLPTAKTTTTIVFQGKLYRWNGSAYVTSVPATDVTGQFTSAQIASLEAAKLAGKITSTQIGTGAVLSAAIAAAAVTAAKLADGSVTAAKVADAAITTAKFAAGLRPVEIVSTLPGTPHVAGRVVYLTTDGKLYRNTGSGWVASVAAADVTGQLTSAQIVSLDAAKLAGQITSTQIGTGAVLSAAIADAAVSDVKIAAAAVTAASLAAGAVTADAVAANAITSVKIAAGAVTAGKVAANSITATEIAAGTITATEIAAGAITAAKLAVGAVTADAIAANAIVAGKVAAGAIGATEIAARGITASKLALIDTDNLIRNASFEDGLDGWYTYGGTVTRYSGEHGVGLRLEKSASTAEVGAQQTGWTAYPTMPVAAGEVLRVKCKVRRIAGVSGGNCGIFARIYFADGTNTGTAIGGVTASTPIDTTVQVSGVWTVPANVTGVSWQVYYGSNASSAGGVILITDASVTRMSGAELIVDGAITAVKVAANAIEAAAIATGAITSVKIATGAVTADAVAANAITSVKIAAGAVTAGKVAANSITATEIAAGTITATEIAARAITSVKIAAGAVTANEIAANTITAAKIAAGAIGASQIAAGAILASKLSVSDFTNQVPDSEIQDAASWVRNSKISINTTALRADSRSLGSLYYDHSLNTDGSDAAPYSAGFFPVTPGDELFVSGQVIREGGTRIQMRVYIMFYDRNDTILATDGSLVAISLWGITTNTSVPYTGTVTVPSGAFQARYRYYIYGAAGETDGNLHLGAPVVRIKSRGELIVDGAINAARIAAGAITAASIAAGAITASAIAAGAVGASQIAAGAVTAAKISAGSITADKFAAGQIIAGDLIVDGAVSATYTVAVPVSLLINATGSSSDAVGGSVAATFAATQGGADFPSNPVEITLSTFVSPITESNGRVTFLLQRLVSGSWTHFTDFDIFHTGAAGHFFWRGLGGNNYSFGVPPSGSYRLRARIRSGPNVTVSNLLMTMRQLNK